jgi:adenylate cyclase
VSEAVQHRHDRGSRKKVVEEVVAGAKTVRIGIDTGPVIAGVIGIRRFIYDVWGDTVNTASRMESHGLPGKIQVTERTYAALCDRYAFVERGVIDVKGRGPMRTWLLEGRLA